MLKKLIDAGASIQDMTLICQGQSSSASVWRICERQKHLRKYLEIDHSPQNHHRFPVNVRAAVKWYLFVLVF